METAGSMTHAAACAPHKIYIYIKPEIDVMHMESASTICAGSPTKSGYDIGSSTSPNHQSGGIRTGGPGIAGGKLWQPVGENIWREEEDSI